MRSGTSLSQFLRDFLPTLLDYLVIYYYFNGHISLEIDSRATKELCQTDTVIQFMTRSLKSKSVFRPDSQTNECQSQLGSGSQ